MKLAVSLSRCRVLWGLLACCLAMVGCGRSGVEVVPVEGKITYGGGSWPVGGNLMFAPVSVAEGQPRRSAVATFDTEGNFRATSFHPGDGLVPGEYQAAIECWKVAPGIGVPRAISYVPDKFQSPATSGLKVTVPQGQRKVAIQWDVPKP